MRYVLESMSASRSLYQRGSVWLLGAAFILSACGAKGLNLGRDSSGVDQGANSEEPSSSDSDEPSTGTNTTVAASTKPTTAVGGEEPSAAPKPGSMSEPTGIGATGVGNAQTGATPTPSPNPVEPSTKPTMGMSGTATGLAPVNPTPVPTMIMSPSAVDTTPQMPNPMTPEGSLTMDPSMNPSPRTGGSYCGDGVLDPGEQCDDGMFNGTGACDTHCAVVDFDAGSPDAGLDAGPASQTATCGDGIVQMPEICDDGNVLSGDGCAADCLSIEM